MTRINLVPVAELCDQHLHGEWREMKRIPNGMLQGRYLDKKKIPAEYTVRTSDNPQGGQGHIYFFTDKLKFLENRYYQILEEAERRGLNLPNHWPDTSSLSAERHQDYNPTPAALALNRKRIAEMMPHKPRYYRQSMSLRRALSEQNRMGVSTNSSNSKFWSAIGL